MDLKITIWCSYHDNNLINEYKLNELNTNIYKLYNTTLFEQHNLNKYFSEFTTMYNVWKNNIKSDVIGFCHYRRYFDLSTINFEDIYNNNEIYGIDEHSGGYTLNNENKEWPFCSNYENIIYNTFLHFLKEYNVPLKQSYEYYYNNFFYQFGCGLYLLKYDTFYYLANIFFNYLNTIIFPNFINDYNVIYNKESPNRNFGYVIEQLFGFLIRNNNYNNSIIKSNKINHTYAYKLKTGNIKEIEYIKNLYITNLKTGFKKFYIISNNINVKDWELLNNDYFYNYIKIIKYENEIENKNYIILS